MIKLYNGGAWLVNGTEIVEDNKDASAVIANLTGKAPVSKEEASKETIAYSILEKHNTSGNMDDAPTVGEDSFCASSSTVLLMPASALPERASGKLAPVAYTTLEGLIERLFNVNLLISRLVS